MEKEKALELYNSFQQYIWTDVHGYIPSDVETKNTVNKVIDEIELQAENWGVTSVKAYWSKVRKELNNID